MDYWEECIAEALCDAGISATDKQIRIVAKWIESAHDNYGLYTGQEVADRNYSSAKDNEINNLNKQLDIEKSKITCRECNGTGRIEGPVGTSHWSISSCYKCNGEGRHLP